MSDIIQHVSETAIWVAHFRALEGSRPDALFQDPLASLLVGGRGKEVAAKMPGSDLVGWSVVIRTKMIDEFILQVIREGVDTIVNLGAGLDTRPYRMNLPPDLRWVEVDFPKLISEKNRILKDHSPRCQLERVGIDLTSASTRQDFFNSIQSTAKKVMVITEGVILYLSEKDVAQLAQELHSRPNFRYWVTEYFSRLSVRQLLTARIGRKLKNAPLLFHPKRWLEFFSERGWKVKQIRYLYEEGAQLGRPAPYTWLMKVSKVLLGGHRAQKFERMAGYVLFEAK